jgi:hypothetical protein
LSDAHHAALNNLLRELIEGEKTMQEKKRKY